MTINNTGSSSQFLYHQQIRSDHVHKKSEIDQNLVVTCQRRNRPPIDYQFLFEGFIE